MIGYISMRNPISRHHRIRQRNETHRASVMASVTWWVFCIRESVGCDISVEKRAGFHVPQKHGGGV